MVIKKLIMIAGFFCFSQVMSMQNDQHEIESVAITPKFCPVSGNGSCRLEMTAHYLKPEAVDDFYSKNSHQEKLYSFLFKDSKDRQTFVGVVAESQDRSACLDIFSNVNDTEALLSFYRDNEPRILNVCAKVGNNLIFIKGFNQASDKKSFLQDYLENHKESPTKVPDKKSHLENHKESSLNEKSNQDQQPVLKSWWSDNQAWIVPVSYMAYGFSIGYLTNVYLNRQEKK
jgi:hypothetical protein